ncbi:hypothetical protein BaRGS_00002990 [Batillaria attramentaria]|uniref:XK-related protein n=1 Tax=Batillaria attramentaria TaxID=370345 RepID=A0ABD0M323_9CAEN
MHTSRSLEYMYYGWKGRSRAEERETCSETAVYSTILRLWESFLEAAPQLCFQLYIVFKEKPEERIATATLRGVAVFSSWASLAVTAVMFFKRHRIGLGETEKVNFTSQLFYFLWRVCETGGRVLCIALFASTFEYWVFAVLCSHYVIMVVWFIWVNSNRDSWAVLTCFLFGYVLLFYMPFHSRPSRYLHLFYYVIFHAENFLMLGLWAGMTSDRDAWFYIPVIVAVVVFFFLHIVMQVVYYKAFHPKSKDIDWCTTCDWKTVHQSLKNLRS